MSKQLKDIRYSVLDLATVIEGHTAADTFGWSMELAQQAEALGYNRYWFAEHHNMIGVASSAPQILIGYIAGGTKTIRVGSGGMMLPNHAPLVVAEQFGTLATLYPDRIDLGLGRAPGTDQPTAYAIRGENMNAPNHFPQDVQKLQRFFSADNAEAKIRANPGEGLDVPIWILGSSTDSAHLAAALGLPYAFASHFAPTYFKEAIKIYRNNFKPSAQLAEPYVMACVNVVAADTDAEATYLFTSLQQFFTSVVTGKRTLLQPPVDNIDDVWSIYEASAVSDMLSYAFIGGPEKLQRKLSAFVDETGVDEIMVTSHIYDHQAKMRSYKIFAEVIDA
ncbi:LLM class flavin-dependent oxidoreductase [Mucilaginibacter myungsuensis]|uniref:Luciferase-like monooxygenase n=1 Tax=Mucilaginibacter myungsuensis TaxID=649104 RepID=A0A929PXX1_9SPHI|nr:LLM class flavin-dependent oxidoreductase [Mucilaginibacter myungsuensis]MBE9663621.1 LLM class flavin-dependent oxidoreductase [Mucilaginibacter myungsuensis]MDN3599055.1 LLM class flavin-dependent oxidoreductase [Mucilaginibacter myungsuensis]